MTPKSFTIQELDAFALEYGEFRERRADIMTLVGSRIPRFTNEVNLWGKCCLADETKKWFLASLLMLTPTWINSFFEDLLIAGIREVNPSLNRAFVKPLRSHIRYEEAIENILYLAEGMSESERGGIARLSYWLAVELLDKSQDSTSALRRINSWKMREFLWSNDTYSLRCLMAGLKFDSEYLDDYGNQISSRVIAKARSHEDDYIRHRLAIQLGESNGPLLPLTP